MLLSGTWKRSTPRGARSTHTSRRDDKNVAAVSGHVPSCVASDTASGFAMTATSRRERRTDPDDSAIDGMRFTPLEAVLGGSSGGSTTDETTVGHERSTSLGGSVRLRYRAQCSR